MSIWVLSGRYDYGRSYVLGTYTSKELVQSELQKFKEQTSYPYDFYDIEETIVDSTF